jgi:tricorn protease
MILTAIAAAAGITAAPMDVRLMRYPSIHGDNVVFTFASDLWISDSSGGVARRLTSHPGLEYRARYSPDGSMIAFSGSYDGGRDVFVMPAEGGEPKRLTYMPGSEFVLGWTPDGKVAFSSSAQAQMRHARLYLVSPEGGMPEVTDLQDVSDISYSPNGKTVALNRNYSHQFNWRGYRGGTQGKIGFFNFEDNSYEEIKHGKENSWMPMWAGDDVYFVSDKKDRTRNLFKYNTKSKRTSQVTNYKDGSIRWPSTDGESIVWERDGKIEVFDIDSSKTSGFTPKVLGDNQAMRARYRQFGSQVSGFSISPSAKRLAVEARGDIYSVPAKNGTTRNLTESPGSRETSPSWSPDGQEIAYLSDASGEAKITIVPQMGGETEVIDTPESHRITGFSYSPKGEWLTYDTVDNRLIIVNRKSGEVREISEDAAGTVQHDWSQDDSWIVYTKTEANLFASINLYNVANDTHHQVTEGYYNSSAPTFDMSGKYLYFVSSRSYSVNMDNFQGGSLHQTDVQRVYAATLTADLPNPMNATEDEEPVKAKEEEKKEEAPADEAEKKDEPEDKSLKIDLDGLAERAIVLPMPPGGYQFAIGISNGVLVYSNGSLLKFDFASKKAAPIITGATSLSLTPKRDTMAFGAGSTVGISPIRPGVTMGTGTVSMSRVAAMWDPAAEYEQMFWEVWRYQRDIFYDANMRGLDWKAVGDKYAAMLPYVGDRTDLDYIFGMMIGETGTGHSYVSPGNPSNGTTADPAPPVGLLGADYEISEGKVRLSKVFRGFNAMPGASGPLGVPGVVANDGDYLLAIDGVPVDAGVSVSSLLVNKVGALVELTLNDSPYDAGSRKVKVRPIGSESQLRYHTWVQERRDLVTEWSDGKVGYMHVPDTNVNGIINFVRGFYSQSGKEAYIIDERFNGGGWIPTFFIEALSRKFDTALQQRNGIDIGFPTQSLDGPKAMLINEHAGSGGDMFPWLFKNSGLGPLIGTRTWGGLVGISGQLSLVDGGGVTSPSFGIYDQERTKWIAENTGVDPDIEVDNDPESLAAGKDAQLWAGVKYLLDELKKGKGRKPLKSPDVIKIKKGGG